MKTEIYRIMKNGRQSKRPIAVYNCNEEQALKKFAEIAGSWPESLRIKTVEINTPTVLEKVVLKEEEFIYLVWDAADQYSWPWFWGSYSSLEDARKRAEEIRAMSKDNYPTISEVPLNKKLDAGIDIGDIDNIRFGGYKKIWKS